MPSWSRMANQDLALQGPNFPLWDAGDVAASLRKYRMYVEAEALQSLDWYWQSKRTVRLLASGLQYSRALLMALAAIVPIIGKLTGNALLSNALLASLFVGTAAALEAGDKHLGISAAWVRYVLAATQIRRALEEFRMDWILLLTKTGPDPTRRQAESFLQLARKFHLAVESVVADDTRSWATSFQSTLANDGAPGGHK
ncbi:MAG TPA: SLATT domain-containing protein [Candidatus Sulfopaludibacter sp.]|nr:SLATT domain-containing protein [Candidatus Sulfopaludibacter sp.]